MNYQRIITVMVGKNPSGYYCEGSLQKGGLVLTSLATFILLCFPLQRSHLNMGLVPTTDLLTLATM